MNLPRSINIGCAIFLVAFVYGASRSSVRAADPLPAWNDGATKKAIIEFVQTTMTPGGANFVAPEERIATFDQDGTLWVEQPIYSQLVFCFERVPAVVKANPALAKQEPFKTVLSGNHAAIAKLPWSSIEKIL